MYDFFHFPTCFFAANIPRTAKKKNAPFIKATTAKASRSQSLVSNPPAM